MACLACMLTKEQSERLPLQLLQLSPTTAATVEAEGTHEFLCPLYCTQARTYRGTGDSRDCLWTVSVACEGSPKVWVERGTALVLEAELS